MSSPNSPSPTSAKCSTSRPPAVPTSSPPSNSAPKPPPASNPSTLVITTKTTAAPKSKAKGKAPSGRAAQGHPRRQGDQRERRANRRHPPRPRRPGPERRRDEPAVQHDRRPHVVDERHPSRRRPRPRSADDVAAGRAAGRHRRRRARRQGGHGHRSAGLPQVLQGGEGGVQSQGQCPRVRRRVREERDDVRDTHPHHRQRRPDGRNPHRGGILFDRRRRRSSCRSPR